MWYRKGFVLVACALLVSEVAVAQPVQTLIENPDLDVTGGRGPSTFDAPSYPYNQSSLGGLTAAASWHFAALGLWNETKVKTELVSSDVVRDGKVLHVRAQMVSALILIPTVIGVPPAPHPAYFCAWIKIVHGDGARVDIGGLSSHIARTAKWQQIRAIGANVSDNQPTITVPASLPGSGDALGEAEYYLESATMTLKPLRDCPRQVRVGQHVHIERQPL